MSRSSCSPEVEVVKECRTTRKRALKDVIILSSSENSDEGEKSERNHVVVRLEHSESARERRVVKVEK